LAYQVERTLSLKNISLLVVSSDGKIKTEVDMASLLSLEKVPHEGIVQWLDDKRLMIAYGGDDGKYASTFIFNPFTGEKKTISSDYPGMYGQNNMWGRYDLTMTVYNPVLSRVIYPSFSRVILWDLQLKKKVSEFLEPNVVFGSEPVWSPDGESFIVDLAPKDAPEQGRNLFWSLMMAH